MTETAVPTPKVAIFDGEPTRTRMFQSSLKSLLMANNLFDVCSGLLPMKRRPELRVLPTARDKKLFEKRFAAYQVIRAKHQKACGTIRAHVAESVAALLDQVNPDDNAEVAWKAIEEHFALKAENFTQLHAILREIEDLKMKPSDHFATWVTRFIQLTARAKLSLVQQKQQFEKAGYLLPHLKTSWRTSCEAELSWEETIKRMKVADNFFQSDVLSRSSKAVARMTTAFEEEEVSESVKKERPFTGKCWNCLAPGHRGDQCPAGVCRNCQSWNASHRAIECPNKRRTTAGTKPAVKEKKQPLRDARDIFQRKKKRINQLSVCDYYDDILNAHDDDDDNDNATFHDDVHDDIVDEVVDNEYDVVDEPCMFSSLCEQDDSMTKAAVDYLRTSHKKICAIRGGMSSQSTKMKIDSGADVTVVPSVECLTSIDEVTRGERVHTATGESLAVTASGAVSNWLREVLVCPAVQEGLLSTIALQQQGMEVRLLPLHVHPDVGAIIYDKEGQVVMIADQDLRVEVGMSKGEVEEIMNDSRLQAWRPAKEVCRIKGQSAAYRQLQDLYVLVHEALAHPSYETMCRIADTGCIAGFPLTPDQVRRHRQQCVACVRGKMSRAALTPFRRSSGDSSSHVTVPRKFAEKLCSDVYGPMPRTSGKQYAITYTASPGSFVSVYMVSQKNELVGTLQHVIEEYRRHGRHSDKPQDCIEVFQSDSEAIYMDQAVNALLTKEGIRHQSSAPYVHQQNEVAERMHRTVGEVVSTMFAAAPHLPKEMWPHAVRYAAYCLNLHPRRGRQITPYEEFYHRKPSFLSYPLLPFGQPLEFLVPVELRSWKGAAHSTLGAYLGPQFSSKKTIKVLHLDSKRVVSTFSYWLYDDLPVMQRYQFDHGPMFIDEEVEREPPQGGDEEVPVQLPAAVHLVLPGGDVAPRDDNGVEREHLGVGLRDGEARGGERGGLVAGSDSVVRAQRALGPLSHMAGAQGVREDRSLVMTPSVTAHQSHRGLREEAVPGVSAPLPSSQRGTAPVQDAVTTSHHDTSAVPDVAIPAPIISAVPDVVIPAPIISAVPDVASPAEDQGTMHGYSTRSTAKKLSRLEAGEIFNHLLDRVMRVMKVSRSVDTPSLSVALKSKEKAEWLEAINKELDQLKEMEVYTLVDKFPLWARPIRTHFVLKASRDSAGQIYKFKARLVGQGNRQDPSTYDLVQSPTARSAVVRLLLALAVHHGRKVEAYDVPGAYLNSKTSTAKSTNGDPGLYIILPDGTKGKLEKFLYGLKQAGLEWHETIKSFLALLNYRQSPAEPCLFVWRENGQAGEGSAFGKGERFHLLVIYVDDFLAFGSDDDIEESFYSLLCDSYGKITRKQRDFTFLSIEIKQHEDGSATLSMPGYCRKMLKEYGLSECQPTANPDYSTAAPKDDTPGDQEEFMSMLGSLMYLACSVRFDLLCVLSKLAAKSRAPTRGDNKAIKRVLRYVKGSLDDGITFRPGHEARLVCMVDASFDSEPESRSRSGMLFSLGDNQPAFHARSVKQVMIATSSTEAEYIALYEAVLEIIWIRYLLADMCHPQVGPTRIHEDNESCIQIAGGAGALQRTKHYGRRLHYTRKAKEDGLIEIHHLDTSQMTADLLTKALPDQDFRRHRLSLLGR